MGGVQENEMTKEELQAVLDAQDAKVAQLVKSAVDEAVKAQSETVDAEAEAKAKEDAEAKAKEDAELKAPTFTGDPLDADALGEYEKSLRGFELSKAIASGEMTADKLAELRKSLTEKLPSVEELTEAGIKAEEGDSAEVRKLQVQLFKARKSSNVPERSDASDDDEITELAKATADEAAALGTLLNAHLGVVEAPVQTMRVVQG